MAKMMSQEWLLIFYSVPSHPVSNRMKIWRKLAKTGAVPLKGAIYVLPANEDHEELFQWLIGEVKSMGGDGAFVRTRQIETMDEADIRKLFVLQSEKEYRGLDKAMDALERKIQSVRKGTRLPEKGGLIEQLSRMKRDFEEIRKRDFFSSGAGVESGDRIRRLEVTLKSLGKGEDRSASIVSKAIAPPGI